MEKIMMKKSKINLKKIVALILAVLMIATTLAVALPVLAAFSLKGKITNVSNLSKDALPYFITVALYKNGERVWNSMKVVNYPNYSYKYTILSGEPTDYVVKPVDTYSGFDFKFDAATGNITATPRYNHIDLQIATASNGIRFIINGIDASTSGRVILGDSTYPATAAVNGKTYTFPRKGDHTEVRAETDYFLNTDTVSISCYVRFSIDSLRKTSGGRLSTEEEKAITDYLKKCAIVEGDNVIFKIDQTFTGADNICPGTAARGNRGLDVRVSVEDAGSFLLNGSLRINKEITAGKGASIKDGTFGFTVTKDGKTVATPSITTKDGSGFTDLSGLEPGLYIVRETSYNANTYLPAGLEYQVTVKEDGSTASVTFTNHVPGKAETAIKVTKSHTISEIPCGTFTFELYGQNDFTASNGDLILKQNASSAASFSITTLQSTTPGIGSNSYTVTGLDTGTYWIVETGTTAYKPDGGTPVYNHEGILIGYGIKCQGDGDGKLKECEIRNVPAPQEETISFNVSKSWTSNGSAYTPSDNTAATVVVFGVKAGTNDLELISNAYAVFNNSTTNPQTITFTVPTGKYDDYILRESYVDPETGKTVYASDNQTVILDGLEYKVTFLARGNNVFTVNNDMLVETDTVSVSKSWVNVSDSALPDALTVTLYDGRTAIHDFTMTAANQWTASFDVIRPTTHTPSYSVGEKVGNDVYKTNDRLTINNIIYQLTITSSNDDKTFSLKNKQDILTLTINKYWGDELESHPALRFEIYGHSGNDSFKAAEVELPADKTSVNVTVPLYFAANGEYVKCDTFTIHEIGESEGTITLGDLTYSVEYVTGTVSADPAPGETPAFHVANILMTDIPVTKSWDDNNNPNRPESATLVLYKQLEGDEEKVEVKRFTFSGAKETDTQKTGLLPTFALVPNTTQLKKINYTVAEPTVPDNYYIALDSNDPFAIINTLKVSVPFSKVWDDDSNRDGLRPDSIIIALYDGNKLIDEGTVTGEGNVWNYTFQGLRKPVDGFKIVETAFIYGDERVNIEDVTDYSFGEVNLIDNIYTVTNTHTPIKTTITVVKEWNDADNNDGLRGDVTVSIYPLNIRNYSTNDIYAARITEADGWLTTISVYKYIDGTEVQYTLTETSVNGDIGLNGYLPEVKTVGDSITLTNTHDPEKKLLTIRKEWNNVDNSIDIPRSVSFDLLADGEVVDFYWLNATDNWTLTLKVDAYDNGREIYYSVRETTYPANFVSTVEAVSVGMTMTFTIKNTYTPPVVPPETEPETTAPETEPITTAPEETDPPVTEPDTTAPDSEPAETTAPETESPATEPDTPETDQSGEDPAPQTGINKTLFVVMDVIIAALALILIVYKKCRA